LLLPHLLLDAAQLFLDHVELSAKHLVHGLRRRRPWHGGHQDGQGHHRPALERRPRPQRSKTHQGPDRDRSVHAGLPT
jgi:hypothetical protein